VAEHVVHPFGAVDWLWHRDILKSSLDCRPRNLVKVTFFTYFEAVNFVFWTDPLTARRFNMISLALGELEALCDLADPVHEWHVVAGVNFITAPRIAYAGVTCPYVVFTLREIAMTLSTRYELATIQRTGQQNVFVASFT
jgi:hypothetical protein